MNFLLSIDGVDIYMFGKPTRDFVVLKSRRGRNFSKAHFSKGIMTSNLDEDLNIKVRRLKGFAKRKKISLDGVLYTNGSRASAIRFL